MGTKANLMTQKLKQKGHFNFADLYELAFNHLSDEGYIVAEEEYTEKIAANGKNIEISWVASRAVTDYFKYVIKVGWDIKGMTDVQAQQDGKPVDTNKGELNLKISAVFETDYEDKWENKPFWKFMRGVYDKYIIRKTIEEYTGGLIDETLDLIKQVKAFLNLGK